MCAFFLRYSKIQWKIPFIFVEGALEMLTSGSTYNTTSSPHHFMWAPTSVSPWEASALLRNFINTGPGLQLKPGCAQRSDSCLTECNNCDAAVGVLLRQGNESISEMKPNWSSSAAVKADQVRAASSEKCSEFIRVQTTCTQQMCSTTPRHWHSMPLAGHWKSIF